MNQADYFYYSGHGNHRWGTVHDWEPSAISGYWNRDLDCVVFSACSVLDINDYNNNYELDPANHAASPGKLWESVGPKVLLGYNYTAPADEDGATARIIRSWLARRKSLGDIDAWMEANDNRYGRYACAIERNVRYVYFKKVIRGIYIKKNVKKENR